MEFELLILMSNQEGMKATCILTTLEVKTVAIQIKLTKWTVKICKLLDQTEILLNKMRLIGKISKARFKYPQAYIHTHIHITPPKQIHFYNFHFQPLMIEQLNLLRFSSSFNFPFFFYIYCYWFLDCLAQESIYI